MREEPERIPATRSEAAQRVWRGLQLSGYEGGPFGDQICGPIAFEAEDRDAKRAVAGDPFLTEGLVREDWMTE